MRRQLMGVLVAATVMMGGVIKAQAAEPLGSLLVILGQTEKPASVTLYHVGEPAEDGYRIVDSCGGGFVKGYDAQSPELALWLSEQISGDGWEIPLDETGRAVYEGLQEGLYLLVQTRSAAGVIPVSPFLICLPCNGQWELTAYPKQQKLLTEAPRTAQHPAPLLGAMGMVLTGLGLAACVDKIRKNR